MRTEYNGTKKRPQLNRRFLRMLVVLNNDGRWPLCDVAFSASIDALQIDGRDCSQREIIIPSRVLLLALRVLVNFHFPGSFSFILKTMLLLKVKLVALGDRPHK